jgi:antitoxin HigA-1
MHEDRSQRIQRSASRYFGNSAQFWLDLQSQYDIAIAEHAHGAEIKKRVHPADAA